MSTIQRFEDLEVWQDARRLCRQIFTLSPRFGKDYRFFAQITAAAGSVMDNIAEGFERNGQKEFIQFLFIAKGSCGEVRSQLARACDFGYIDEAEHERLCADAVRLSTALANFIKYLRGTTYAGTKYKFADCNDLK